MLTHTPNEAIKVVICENRLEFLRGKDMVGVDRDTIHRLVDDWIDHQVREAWSLSVKAPMLQLLDKERVAGA